MGYRLLEYTSSGLGHHMNSHIKLLPFWFIAAHSPIFSTSEVVADINFGEININTTSNTVDLVIKNDKGDEFLKHSIDLSGPELRFNSSALDHNRDFCLHIQRSQVLLNAVGGFVRNTILWSKQLGFISIQAHTVHLANILLLQAAPVGVVYLFLRLCLFVYKIKYN